MEMSNGVMRGMANVTTPDVQQHRVSRHAGGFLNVTDFPRHDIDTSAQDDLPEIRCCAVIRVPNCSLIYNVFLSFVMCNFVFRA